MSAFRLQVKHLTSLLSKVDRASIFHQSCGFAYSVARKEEVKVLSTVFQGRSFPCPPPPSKCPASPQKYCYDYSIQVTISEKSSRRDEVSAHTVTFFNIVSQKCTRLHLSAYSFQKISRGHASGPPLGS